MKHFRRYGSLGKGKSFSRAESEKVLDYIELMNPGYRSRRRLSRNHQIVLPEKFCFISNPNGAIKAIVNIVKSYRDDRVKHITLNHSQVSEFSLTSEVLLGLGVNRARLLLRRGRKIKKRVSGYFPLDPDHKQLLMEMGVVKEIEAKTKSGAPFSREKQHLFAKHSINFSSANAYSVDDHSLAAEAFVKHVNECVQDFEKSLSEDAETELLRCVGEVLDNAQRHSSKKKNDYSWFIRGYLNSHSDNKDFELSIFNFGRTIAESFEDLPTGHFSLNLVNDYVELHKNRFTREQLITVAALQQRYSCRNQTSRDTNGQGTILLIEFFQELYKEFHALQGETEEQNNHRMSVVSGATHIYFDGTYKLRDLHEDSDDEQMIIAFNNQNTLKLPPDSSSVRRMKDCFFPGVAISIRFPLKKRSS
ncbi:hypothetical protein MED92_07271 [Oceanospirillum sp. MED92]|uniref:Uncharacterized protein n=1 Tax=Neptuniibacter caesariensis TaxID=207954 RepID=A0A7U8CA42_NEPCE|nr:hypothetical protein MED92_07271 [Oceanospirillum sp. MED92] [Neptuniibacter caesariensis]